MGIILCFDDSSSRYEKMYREAAKRGITVIVTDQRSLIYSVLRHKVEGNPVIGICLDHDMPGVKTLEEVEELICPYSIKTVVVTNNSEGALRLRALLDSYAVPNAKIRAGSMDWEERVIDYFTTPQEG